MQALGLAYNGLEKCSGRTEIFFYWINNTCIFRPSSQFQLIKYFTSTKWNKYDNHFIPMKKYISQFSNRKSISYWIKQYFFTGTDLYINVYPKYLYKIPRINKNYIIPNIDIIIYIINNINYLNRVYNTFDYKPTNNKTSC